MPCHYGIVYKLVKFGVPRYLVRFVKYFLSDRSFRVLINEFITIMSWPTAIFSVYHGHSVGQCKEFELFSSFCWWFVLYFYFQEFYCCSAKENERIFGEFGWLAVQVETQDECYQMLLHHLGLMHRNICHLQNTLSSHSSRMLWFFS